MKLRTRLLVLAAPLALSLFLGGCATATQPTAMTAAPAATNHRKHPGDVALTVTGGKETNPAWTSQISSEDFRTALKQSLLNAGSFTGVVEGAEGKYQLSAFLSRLDQPMMGFSMTVKMEVGYTLKDSAGKVLWQKSIESSFTAHTSDAFAGVKRLRLATEGAARENISSLIGALDKLDLP